MSGMSGINGMNGMSGMSSMSGISGMNGISGISGMSGMRTISAHRTLTSPIILNLCLVHKEAYSPSIRVGANVEEFWHQVQVIRQWRVCEDTVRASWGGVFCLFLSGWNTFGIRFLKGKDWTTHRME